VVLGLELFLAPQLVEAGATGCAGHAPGIGALRHNDDPKNPRIRLQGKLHTANRSG
jgi:hypothetical protein